MVFTRRLFPALLATAATLCALLIPEWAPKALATGQTQTQVKAGNDLDQFMARVLKRRDENWKTLHDYILSETERFELTGPGGTRLNAMRRDYTWYIRDGFLIRSPLKFDGVVVSEQARREYEQKWMEQEKRREERHQKAEARAAERGEVAEPEEQPGKQETAGGKADDVASLQGIGTRIEPRFISEAFFLRFRFDVGNYYLAGREQIDGRQVVRIEYYPKQLFGQHERRGDAPRKEQSKKDQEMEKRIEQGMNKVSLVTLWIDPTEYQVVRYKFDNVDFGFLPARWLVRVDDITATMSMGRVLSGVWLPREMEARAGITLANGTYRFDYGRQFYDYRKAETSARIRSYGTDK